MLTSEEEVIADNKEDTNVSSISEKENTPITETPTTSSSLHLSDFDFLIDIEQVLTLYGNIPKDDLTKSDKIAEAVKWKLCLLLSFFSFFLIKSVDKVVINSCNNSLLTYIYLFTDFVYCFTSHYSSFFFLFFFISIPINFFSFM